MCDKGILEMFPDSCKLEYCIEVPAKMYQKFIKDLEKILGEPVEMINSAGKYPDESPRYSNTMAFKLKSEPSEWYTVCSFSLKEMPGCCGILVSYHTNVSPKYQNRGIGKLMQAFKEEIAIFNYYSQLICTTTSTNTTQNLLLGKFGWTKLSENINRRTGNTVYIWTKNLPKRDYNFIVNYR